MRALRFFLVEASRSIWRRRAASLLALVTSAVSLFILGLFLLGSTNAGRVLERWGAAAEFSVYLADGVSGADRAALEATLAGSGMVERQAYVSPQDALVRFARQFPDLAAAAASLKSNPLPASYEVRLRTTDAQGGAEALAARVRNMSGVADVRYDRRWIDRLLGLVRVVRRGGIGLALLLIVASAVTMMSAVRLALFARRQEIEIMQLVGAPLAFIRGPFVMEGTLLGLGGAIVALAALAVFYTATRGPLVAWASGIVDTGDLVFLPATLIAALLAGGTILGCIGGALASRLAR